VKRLVFVLLIAVASIVGISALPHSSLAGNLPNWPALNPNCKDVSGDGYVDLPNDILGVIQRHNAQWGDDNYALLYDVSGGGIIDLPNDILGVVLAHNSTCSVVDTQVVQATLAVMKYQDQSVAIADGYVQVTQNIGGHGIHWLKGSLMDGVFDLTEPEGLNYSLNGDLLAAYYIDPLWMAGHELPPPGFDTDEDMWHDHPGLCMWQGPSGPLVAEGWTEQQCLDVNGAWFESFGWMVHLWNFLPNAMGRFMMHNEAAG